MLRSRWIVLLNAATPAIMARRCRRRIATSKIGGTTLGTVKAGGKILSTIFRCGVLSA